MDDNKHIAIASVAAFLSLLLLIWVFSGGKPDAKESSTREIVAEKPVSKQWQQEEEPQQPVRQTTFSAPAAGSSSPFSDEERQKMLERDKENEVLIEKAATNWLLSMASDETLSEKTREKYKMKLNKSYVEGTNAKKQKNYPVAIKKFYEAIKAPEATPISKYYSLLNIKTMALKLKDMDLFIAASKLEAELIALENLSAIGIKKSTEQREWISTFEKLMQAKKDPAVLNDLIQKRMEENNGACTREEIEETLLQETEQYEEIFKELMG